MGCMVQDLAWRDSGSGFRVASTHVAAQGGLVIKSMMGMPEMSTIHTCIHKLTPKAL